ncbi:MAG: acyltransferase [Lysobacteraceae bacterium]|nr:MAG: acyltransferase [Xanthomonadaceae bacterium]
MSDRPSVAFKPVSMAGDVVGHLVWPDIFRGVAALLVCAGHLRAALFVDHESVTNPGLLAHLFYLVSGLGHQAVMVFFVLSGFLVGGSVLRSRRKPNMVNYSLSRLTRLWVVLIPALGLTFIVDSLVLQIAPNVLNGGMHELWGSVPAAGQHSVGLFTLFGNALFLQSLAVPTYGSNGPLWSLAYEFWYYVAFPLLVILCTNDSGRDLWRKAVALVVLMAIIMLAPTPLRLGFVVWLMGVGVWALNQRRYGFISSPYFALFSAVVLGAALAYSKVNPVEFTGGPADIWVGLSFSLLLASLLQQRRQPALGRFFGSWARRLSDISYSFYAIHFPLVLLIGVLLGTTTVQLVPELEGISIYLASLAILCGAGWLMWWTTERHTPAVKRWLQGRIASVYGRHLTKESRS